MSTKTEHLPRADRRRTIVDSALTVFCERGFVGASLEEIARRAGITKPIVYRHFEDKADLYLTVLDEQGQELVRRTAEAATSGTDRPLHDSLDAFYGYFEEQPFTEQLLARAGSHSHPLAREGQSRVQEMALSGTTRMLLMRYPGLHSEDPARRIEVGRAAEMVLAALVALATWWRRNPDATREAVVQSAVAFVEGAVPGLFPDLT